MKTPYEEMTEQFAKVLADHLKTSVRGKVSIYFTNFETMIVEIYAYSPKTIFRYEEKNIGTKIVRGLSAPLQSAKILKKYRSHIVNKYFITN